MITYLSYQEKNMKFPLNIHIEFSTREKPLTMKETILITPYPVILYPFIVHLDWEEILAEKIRALLKRNVKLAEAPSHGKPICLYDPASAGALAYKQLSEEVLQLGP